MGSLTQFMNTKKGGSWITDIKILFIESQK